DVAAIPADPKFAYPAAHEPDPDCMGKLMTKHIKQHRPWQPEKCYHPEQRAERKKPEFFRSPESMPEGCGRKAAEKDASQDTGGRNQKDRDNLFQKSNGDDPLVFGDCFQLPSAFAPFPIFHRTRSQKSGVQGLQEFRRGIQNTEVRIQKSAEYRSRESLLAL